MRVGSGIQPTGKPHLGNYLGAIRNFVKLQDDATAQGGECLIFIADLHAISLPHDPAELYASTLELVATLVACGLDTDKTILFNQAQVPAHSEQIGRASCRERVCQYVYISGVAGSLNKKKKLN